MSIKCYHLSKAFKSKALFTDINVTLERGMCHCITGENGSGKTTLLKIMAGLQKSDSGFVQLGGACTYSGSNPFMLNGTVAYNIEYPLTLKRQKKRAQNLSLIEVLDIVGLSGLEFRQAHTLSSGEKQKVALARALIWNPDILLLDEPTANIDRESIESIERMLRQFVDKKDRTLVLVSHDKDQPDRMKGLNWQLKNQELVMKG